MHLIISPRWDVRRIGRQTRELCVLGDLRDVKDDINAYGYSADTRSYIVMLSQISSLPSPGQRADAAT
jgi:hypothetical protein